MRGETLPWYSIISNTYVYPGGSIVTVPLKLYGQFKYSNDKGVMTRPIWRMMTELEMFKDCQHDGLENSLWLEDRVVNIPSSVPMSEVGV